MKRLTAERAEAIARLKKSTEFQEFMAWARETLDEDMATLINPGSTNEHLAGQCFRLRELVRRIEETDNARGRGELRS